VDIEHKIGLERKLGTPTALHHYTAQRRLR